MAGSEPARARHARVDENSHGQRVDNFLVRECPGVPRSHLYRLIRKGQIRVDGKRVKQTRKLVKGELVRIPPLVLSASSTTVPESLVARVGQWILIEQADFLVVNKPPGLAVHAGSGLAFGLIDALRQYYETTSLELSHRLDRDTSGCLLIGRNRRCNRQLQELFRKRVIDKRYLALVDGQWPPSLGCIDVPLSSNQSHAGERRVMVDSQGQSALTRFKLLDSGQEASLLAVTLDTGRTHQIRVHTRHAGHAVIGDRRYGDNARNRFFRQQGLKRMFLHSESLCFQWQGRRVLASAPTENTWQLALGQLGLSGGSEQVGEAG